MLRRNYFLLFFVIIGMAAFTVAPRVGVAKGWVSLFNGKDLSGWDTYLGPPADDNGKQLSKEPIGLNKDPNHVFSVTRDVSEYIISISRENLDCITSKKEFADYHLQLQFHCGERSWGN